jgi:hypothetical protein
MLSFFYILLFLMVLFFVYSMYVGNLYRKYIHICFLVGKVFLENGQKEN